MSEYSEIVFQKHDGLCATWNQATTCSTKSDYSDTLLGRECSRTKGQVLAACAGLLASDLEEAKEALDLVAYRHPRERPARPSR